MPIEDTTEQALEPTPEISTEGLPLLQWVKGFNLRGKTDGQIENVVWLVREVLRRDGVSPTEHGMILRYLKQVTGLTKADLALPPPIDPWERNERAKRRADYEAGECEFIDPENGQDCAARFLRASYDDRGWPEFVRHEGDFFRARLTHYTLISDEEVCAAIYEHLRGKKDVSSGDPIKPEKVIVERILHSTKAAALIGVQSFPAWIGDPRGKPPAENLIPFQNGILDVESRQLLHRTRGFFTLGARPFPYLPKSRPPLAWLTFLGEICGEDRETIECLQQWFGYLLVADTSQQKLLLLLGPPRSGKGTLLRTLRELLGAENCCAPTLQGLGGPFGLSGLVGKLAALISDARLGGRTDIQTVSEAILRVTGQDTVSVPRKFRSDWVGRLTTRFVIVSNEVPALLDQSGAIANRFIVLQLTRSFLGKEDPGLTDRLLRELPGIAMWALEGLDRLRERGHFVQPASGLDAFEQLAALGSPIKAFVSDRCEIKPGASTPCADLYQEWVDWCAGQGRDQPGTLQVFGRNVSAAYPEIRVARHRDGDTRQRTYEGIGLVRAGS